MDNSPATVATSNSPPSKCCLGTRIIVDHGIHKRSNCHTRLTRSNFGVTTSRRRLLRQPPRLEVDHFLVGHPDRDVHVDQLPLAIIEVED